MRYFPIFIDTKDQSCLVIGAGEVAARKVELLLKTPAEITVVAPEVCDTIAQLAESGKITLQKRPFAASDIQEQKLIFVATNDNQLNAHIHQLATAKGVLVNVVDNPPLCEFITPAIVDRAPIVVALSSGGVAPVLLRYLRQKLEAVLPKGIGKLGALFETFRDKVKARFNSVDERRNFWEQVMESNIAELAQQGQIAAASQALESKLTNLDKVDDQGCVYLIGAGPGDPELLTFKAVRLMQKADVVVYDRLVSQDILELARRDAEKVYVGKAKSNHTLPQEAINDLLVKRALKGERVVRLKGGDPFVFGRGGEEIQTLQQHGIPVQVVPGITAATGAASYSGIPLTHRDHAQSVVFATGHLQDNSINLNWSALAQKRQTLVFYMGLTGLSILCRELIKYGMPQEMPVALVQSATCENQKVVTGTLDNIVATAELVGMKPPTLIIVGTVVQLRQQLSWLENQHELAKI